MGQDNGTYVVGMLYYLEVTQIESLYSELGYSDCHENGEK